MTQDCMPNDPISRELWRMGFTEQERERIIKTAHEMKASAVALGEFIQRSTPLPDWGIKSSDVRTRIEDLAK